MQQRRLHECGEIGEEADGLADIDEGDEGDVAAFPDGLRLGECEDEQREHEGAQDDDGGAAEGVEEAEGAPAEKGQGNKDDQQPEAERLIEVEIHRLMVLSLHGDVDAFRKEKGPYSMGIQARKSAVKCSAAQVAALGA